MNDVFGLSGKLALVTGGCRGIGAAIALAFQERGAQVIVHGRGSEQARTFAHDHSMALLEADFSKRSDIEALAATLADTYGHLDILVNNAGMETYGYLDEIDAEAIHQQIMVDLEAPIILTRCLLPALRRSSAGSIINVSSIHGSVPYKGFSIYCAAKAGLEAFTRTLAVELGPDGVRVNAIAPGAIETDMNREILDSVGREEFAEWIPLGAVGQTKDIADPAVFLASDASRYITGDILTVDGAYSLHLVRYRS